MPIDELGLLFGELWRAQSSLDAIGNLTLIYIGVQYGSHELHVVFNFKLTKFKQH